MPDDSLKLKYLNPDNKNHWVFWSGEKMFVLNTNKSQMCANMTKDFINQIISPVISTNKSDLFIYIHIV